MAQIFRNDWLVMTDDDWGWPPSESPQGHRCVFVNVEKKISWLIGWVMLGVVNLVDPGALDYSRIVCIESCWEHGNIRGSSLSSCWF